MKVLGEIFKSLRFIPDCEGGKNVLEINNIATAEAVLSENVKCPLCDSDKGFYVPADKGWICKACFASEAVKPKGGEFRIGNNKVLSLESITPEVDNVHVIDNLKQEIEWIEWARAWVKEPAGFVLLSGTNGTGKTFFAETLANESRVNQKKFCVLSELNISWKDQIEKWRSDTYMLNQMSEYDLLILDDLGAVRSPTDAFLDFLYALIDRRYRMKSPTIVTTNLNHADLRQRFGDAISSRLTSGKIFRFIGSDRRRNF